MKPAGATAKPDAPPKPPRQVLSLPNPSANADCSPSFPQQLLDQSSSHQPTPGQSSQESPSQSAPSQGQTPLVQPLPRKSTQGERSYGQLPPLHSSEVQPPRQPPPRPPSSPALPPRPADQQPLASQTPRPPSQRPSSQRLSSQRPTMLNPPAPLQRQSSSASTTRQKTFDDPQPSSAGALEDQILTSLECPVCMEYMTPPIPLCANGHSVCGECAVRIKDCPACRRPMLRTRNLALEALSRGLRYPCRFAAAGCALRLDADEVLNHARNCKCRPMACALRWGRVGGDACPWTGPASALPVHLSTRHPRRFSFFADSHARAVAWEISHAGSFRSYSHVVFAFGEAFIYHKCFDVKDRKLFLAVARVGGAGSGDDAGDSSGVSFRYKFKASRGVDGKRLSLSAAVHSVDDDLATLMQAGNTVSIPFEVLVAFGSNAKRLFSIRREGAPQPAGRPPKAATVVAELGGAEEEAHASPASPTAQPSSPAPKPPAAVPPSIPPREPRPRTHT